MDPVAKRPVIGHRANALGRDGPAERDAASRENGQPSEPAETIWTRLAVDHIPLLTTIEAASYLGYRTPGAIRMAVYRHWLTPSGRGPRRTWMFSRRDLDTLVAWRARASLDGGCRPVRGTEDTDEAHRNEESSTRGHVPSGEPVSAASAGDRREDRQDDRCEEAGALRELSRGRHRASETPRRGPRGRVEGPAKAGPGEGLRALVAEWTATHAQGVNGGKVR